MSIIVNGKETEYKEGLMALDLVKPFNKDIVSCKINGKLRDLVYAIEDGDKVDLLGLNDEDSVRVYEASLRYLIAMAIKRVYPTLKVNCDYYISRSICFKKSDASSFDETEFNNIKEMTIPGMNGGTGMMTAKMYNDDAYRIIPTAIQSATTSCVRPKSVCATSDLTG